MTQTEALYGDIRELHDQLLYGSPGDFDKETVKCLLINIMGRVIKLEDLAEKIVDVAEKIKAVRL